MSAVRMVAVGLVSLLVGCASASSHDEREGTSSQALTQTPEESASPVNENGAAEDHKLLMEAREPRIRNIMLAPGTETAKPSDPSPWRDPKAPH